MKTLRLFEAFGIEMEYMIVDRDTYYVKPIADQLFLEALGHPGGDVEHGEIAWSNELALHVVELKTNGPWPTLDHLAALFQREVQAANRLLHAHNAMLMPSGAHPWMNPLNEAKLWPNDSNEIYESYHRIFDCRGHGWVNLQSTHLNLPFSNDAEFKRLHTAIRLVLPLLPALAASTPFLDGQVSPYLDARLSFYGGNQRKIPEISGSIIPEAVGTYQEYQDKVLQPMYRAIASEDPQGLLQYEWLNSRGAIARFDRMAIEIRILDIQEAPLMDIAIIHLIVSVLKALTEERWSSLEEQYRWHESQLLAWYQQVVQNGMSVWIKEPDYLALFGVKSVAMTVGDLWKHLFQQLCRDSFAAPQLSFLLKEGNLAERLLRAYHKMPHTEGLTQIYAELSACLAQGTCYGS